MQSSKQLVDAGNLLLSLEEKTQCYLHHSAETQNIYIVFVGFTKKSVT